MEWVKTMKFQRLFWFFHVHLCTHCIFQIPLIFVMAFACRVDQKCMSLARLAPQPHLSVLGMQGLLPRPGLHVPATPPCSSLICSAVALEPDGSLPLVSALLLGYRWMKRPGRRSLQLATLQVATVAPPRIDPQIAATFSQTFFFLPFTAMQPIIPLLVAQKFELSAELWGAVCAAEGLAKILCAVPVAALLSSWGRKPVLVLSFICFGFSMTALAHNGTILGLLGAKLLVGAAVLAQNSGMQLFLTDISSSENKSRVMAPVLMAEKLSSMIGPLIGGKLIQVFGATVAMTQLAVITWLVCSTRWDSHKRRSPHVVIEDHRRVVKWLQWIVMQSCT